MIVILQLQLLLALGLFLFQLFLEYIKQVRVMLFSTLLFLMAVGLLIANLSALPKPPDQPPLLSIPANSTMTAQSFTLEEYNQKLTHLTTLTNLQPTDRDVLINLSLLLQAQRQDDKAREYWLAAQRLDPNNPLFVQPQAVSAL